MYRSPDAPSPQRIIQMGKLANYSVYIDIAAGELRMNKQARPSQQKSIIIIFSDFCFSTRRILCENF